MDDEEFIKELQDLLNDHKPGSEPAVSLEDEPNEIENILIRSRRSHDDDSDWSDDEDYDLYEKEVEEAIEPSVKNDIFSLFSEYLLDSLRSYDESLPDKPSKKFYFCK